MLSREKRCIYQKNQIGEVICQLRFPEIAEIEKGVPSEFLAAIREEFPSYSAKAEYPPPRILGQPGQYSLEAGAGQVNHQAVSADGLWRVNLTKNYLALSCRQYTRWEDFAHRLDKPLAVFLQRYQPGFFERMSLRYLNFIYRSDLELENTPWRELISPIYLGPLSDDEISEHASSRCSLDFECAVGGGIHARIHAGPGIVRLPIRPRREPCFIFDQDLFQFWNTPVTESAGVLQSLHSRSYSVFRGAITDTLHEAMHPVCL